ncbi:MAG: TIM-barrel domain-containing protein [Rikenellaceae bacterium]
MIQSVNLTPCGCVVRGLTVFICSLLALGCSSGNFEKNWNGITVKRGDMTIKVDILNESIVHITKSREGIEPDTLQNYVTILEPKTVPLSVEERGGKIIVKSERLELSIDECGVIKYRDKSGNNLVSECSEATWIEPQDSSDNPVSQGFVAGDEAIYGLGQYQSGMMNLRGVPVRMDQFNQEIVIPFIVSTKGYGIYWHNYSISDFNQPTNTLPFEDVEVEQSIVEMATAGHDAEDVANRKVRKLALNLRTTKFTPKKSGLHTFFVESDVKTRMKGDIKLIIGGDTIVNYSTIWAPTNYSGSKELVAGVEYDVIFQNDGASVAGGVTYNEPDFNKTTFTSSVGTKIEYYLVVGDTPSEVIYNYQDLTGRAPLFSKKSYGFWHCRERFHNQQELLENAREYRKREIPVDNIVQDWHYWPNGTKGPEWDRGKYPDPEAMTAELAELNMNLMVSVWPTIKNAPLLERYGISDLQYEGGTFYLDFYDERVQREYYRILSDSMFRMGVKSIWLDGSEPENVKNDVATVVGKFGCVANTYSLLVSKSVYEGRREEFPEERVFNLTRSAYSGQQRYGVASWSGDVAGTWEQFAEQIPAGLNFSMAGVPYWTHDIGGFFRDSRSMNPIYDSQYTNIEYIELLSRWFQFGTFSPLFRLHGYVSQTEVWRYGVEFEALARKYIDLRYALLPYIYSEAWRVTDSSNLLMSPLAYSYPEDKLTWNIDDQYLFGESIMVCPVVDYKARTRSVYLPEGEWYNFWSEEKLEGGQYVDVSAELDELPLLVKAGSIIPFGAKVQYADEESDEPIKFKIYGGADATFELYLDEGDTYNYENGKYTLLSLGYDAESNSVTLATPYDQYVKFAKNPMTFEISLVGDDKIHTVTFNSRIRTVLL